MPRQSNGQSVPAVALGGVQQTTTAGNETTQTSTTKQASLFLLKTSTDSYAA